MDNWEIVSVIPTSNFLALSAFMLVGACSVALASNTEDLYTGRYSSCMDKSGGVTVEMIDCIDEELVSQDGRLNGAYKKLTKELSAARKAQLVAAQRLWLQFRDANCAFYWDPDGGTAAAVASRGCVLSETATRAKELENLYVAEDAG